MNILEPLAVKAYSLGFEYYTTLIEKIWNFESDIEDNTVWTYISYIRKKLDALHSTLKIRTIRGSGYMLEVEYEKR